MTQTISAERIEEMLTECVQASGAGVEHWPYKAYPGTTFDTMREVLTLALSALRAQPQGCATEGCENQCVTNYEAGGVGSYYCEWCLRKVKALATPPAPVDGWGDPQEIERVEADVKTMLAAPVDGGVTDAQVEAAARVLVPVWYGGFEDQRQKEDGTGWLNPPGTPNERARQVARAALTAGRAAVAQDETP